MNGGIGYNEYDLVADGGVDTIYDVSGQGLVKINGKAYGAKTTFVSGRLLLGLIISMGKQNINLKRVLAIPVLAF